MRRIATFSLLVLAAGCAAPPRGTLPVRSVPVANDTAGGELVSAAKGYLGAPYAYGGTTPKGFDCSGLVFRVCADRGVRMPRTSGEQYRVGQSVGQSELKPGDLVFFGEGGRVTHVGIYSGRGKFIHASTSYRRVRSDELRQSYFRKRYLGARRIVTLAR